MWGCASCYSAAAEEEDGSREHIVEIVKKVMVEFFRRDGIGFESRHVSNIVWSLGTIQLPLPSDFLLRLLSACTAVSDDFKDQEDANTIWGLARLSAAALAADEGIHAIRKYIIGRVLRRTDWGVLRPEEFGMVLWGVAVGVGSEADTIVLERLARAASALGRRMATEPPSHRAIANVLWAFASLRYADDNLLRFINLTSPTVARSGSGRHLSNVVCALSDLGCALPDELLDAAIKACSYPPSNATGRHAAGLLRAIAASVNRREVGVAELVPVVATVWKFYDEEGEATARQLFIASLWSSLCTPSPLMTDRKEIEMVVSGAMQGFAVDDAASSRIHGDVAMVLRRIVGPKMLVETSAYGLSVDIGLGGSDSDWFHAGHGLSRTGCSVMLGLSAARVVMTESGSSPGVEIS
ncbi:hypothetical protein Pmar_PMAR010049 [Perkinsus marinus ATCC 50983]|uniref:Uncharacterized protein n=1 Tax=Perkinsus marinus (strain ATCC 50983 / TXsc) TaxID=423536 RepID=C5K4P3_PERM5|nr:hypothetical protein Pmar_PMAR010049 [Perkinsus marinus ATCC 50983]EER20315.1 hypothetical protein Pmar_PMAR010049 [Perkinsus marinus ATCC 50983]|eukprot:XP_002788519.1 hypothetical protein Pmar_PMAR010049 [Perkinsus marinus ATCC 50983]